MRKLKQKIRYFNSKCLLSFFLLSVCVAGKSQDLEAIYNSAYEYDLSVKQQQYIYDSSIEKRDAATADLLPQINAYGRYSSTELDYKDSDCTTQSCLGTYLDDKKHSWGVELTQTIYDPVKYYFRKVEDTNSKIAADRRSLASQNLVYVVSKAYFKLLEAQDYLEYAISEKAAFKETLRQATKKHELGVVTITDVHETQARYDLANANVTLALSRVQSAKSNLERLTGSAIDKLEVIKTNYSIDSLELPSKKDAFDILMQNNLSINIIKQEIEKLEALTQQASANHYPKLDLYYKYDNNNSDNDFYLNHNSNEVGVKFSIPIFNSGKYSSETSSNRLRKRSEETRLSRILRNMKNEIAINYSNINSDFASLTQLNKAVESNQLALKATNTELEIGSRSMLDVLISTQRLYQSKRLLAQVKYRTVINYLDIQRILGALNKSTITTLNELLVEST